ncbi:helix-turn-helix transcriptional regulator [Actinomadura sp. NPDC048955]|uniref:Transcriptional regulator with XRE-family HTH domain n=1 Tax=Actinomadura luteofluorescens TaxID=46163 RepID=A0A7Y9EKW9_9ACTN|nr:MULTISPECIES: helix-turn-helix transcriptional regulator [Actinomadura]MCR3743584.1 Helix-turn-helix domain-containing protein [Actinomadura glauciflava]NYD49040.1 transcriptional regulator with XRE-family HTH domain [Actinomadura luteofluorescens]
MPDSPTVHQRRLRVELRRAREAAELTQEQAAKALEWSLSKIIRIEGGMVRVAVSDVRVMLQQYGVPSERYDEFLGLARAARETAWWSAYRRVLSPQMAELIGFESAAGACREFDPLLVPGLLQISAYAKEILSNLRGEDAPEQISELVEVRLRRQEIFEGDAPPRFYFVIDEAAIRRLVGGAAVMRAQLSHLLEMAKRPNVTIEIVPLDRGAHPGLSGPFKLLEFVEAEDDDVLYLEGAQGELIGRDYREDIVRYREKFEVLRRISLGPEGSAVLLNTVAESL